MQNHNIRFSLNHMVCPSLSAFELIEAAARLGIEAVELRNDIEINSLTEPESAKAIGAKAKEHGIEILSINALYPFNIWNDELEAKTERLAELAQSCGATGIVMCPMNDGDYTINDEERMAGLITSLSAIKKILEKFDLKGFVEPLGFPISSLRFKKDAVTAIQKINAADRFSLVHDTFHHRGAGEKDIFPDLTGLMHISGVEDPNIHFEDMLDAHRVLVGPRDLLGNISQIAAMLAAGYKGLVSFEPFAEEIWNLEDPIGAVRDSMEFIKSELAKA